MDRRRIVIAVVVGLLALGVVAGIATPRTGSSSGDLPASKRIAGAELKDLVSRGVRLVDVRTPTEFAGRHIEGAENVPVDKLKSAAAAWDKEAPIIVYCEVGSRSADAYAYLSGQGFAHVYDLAGGIATWNGEVATGTESPAQAGPSTGRPTMYDFSTDS